MNEIAYADEQMMYFEKHLSYLDDQKKYELMGIIRLELISAYRAGIESGIKFAGQNVARMVLQAHEEMKNKGR